MTVIRRTFTCNRPITTLHLCLIILISFNQSADAGADQSAPALVAVISISSLTLIGIQKIYSREPKIKKIHETSQLYWKKCFVQITRNFLLEANITQR